MTTATAAAAAPSASTSTASSKAATPAPTSTTPAARLTPLFTHTSQHTSYHYSHLPLASATASSSSSSSSSLNDGDDSSAALLQAYYLSRLPLLAKAFGFHERVLATAMSYFKRFWLPHTGRSVARPLRGVKGRALVGGKGVKVIMLISLFLATKTHSTSISLAQFASRVTPAPSSSGSSGGKAQEERQAAVAETSASILDNEFEVASVLGWRFRVTHAFEGVRGLALDLQRLTSRAGGVAQDVGNRTVEGTDGAAGGSLPPEVLDRVKVLLDIASQQLRLTAAEFLYTPSQLALGTWWSLTEEEEGESNSGSGAARTASASSTLTTEERTSLRGLLQRWIDEKESLLCSAPASSSKDPTPPLSLKDFADQIATYVRQGAALQDELRSPACVERVKSIDLALRARAEQEQRDRGVDDAERGAADEEDEAEQEEEEEEDAKGVGAVLGSAAAASADGGSLTKKRKSAPGNEAAAGAGGEQEFAGADGESGGGGSGEKTTADGGGGGAAPKRIKVVRHAE